jgi:WD40 repeat protein
VSEESAGKRVRCPHCQYVIVAPAKARPAEADAPALALPSLELDGEGEKPMATKVSPLPLPPLDPIPNEPSKSESRASPPIEELPEMPSIERGGKRRRPLSSPPPTSKVRWGRIIGIGAVVGVIVIGVILGVVSSKTRPRPQPVVFNQPGGIRPPLNQGINPNQNFAALIDDGLWRPFQSVEHRLSVLFPGNPAVQPKDIRGTQLTAFEVICNEPVNPNQAPMGQVRNRLFTVMHAAIPEKQFKDLNIERRFADVQQSFLDVNPQSIVQNSVDRPFDGVHPGREWSLFAPQTVRWIHVRIYFVRDGDMYHQYVLAATVPHTVQRNHADVTRFFNSFGMLPDGGFKQIIYQQTDTPANNDRRDNEFMTLAVHPARPMVAVGTNTSQFRVVPELPGKAPPAAPFEIDLGHGTSVEQVSVSPDGGWIAVALNGEIELWREWTNGAPKNKIAIPGHRALFVKNDELLVSSAHEIRSYKLDQRNWTATLKLPDLTVKGFAISSDKKTLAVHGDKSIELWNWPDKKLLGKIDAHDADITALVFSPDGQTLASASADRTIKLWHVPTREQQATLKKHAWTVWALAFAPDGKHLVSGGLDGMLLVWNIEPVQSQLVWAASHQFPIRAVAFDNGGKHLYFTCKHPELNVKRYTRQLRKMPWADIKHNPQEAERTLAQNAGLHLPTTSVMSYFTPDGKRFVTTTDGVDAFLRTSSLRVWDTTTATVKYAHSMQGTGILSPDGQWFAYASADAPNHLDLLEVSTNRVTQRVTTLLPPAGATSPPVLFTADSASLWLQRNHQFVRYEIQQPPGGLPTLVEKGRIDLKNPADPRSIHIHPALDHQTFLVELRSQDAMLRNYTSYTSTDGKRQPNAKAPPGEWSQHLNLRRTPTGQVELFDLANGRSQVVGQQRALMFFSAKLSSPVFAIHPQGKIAATASLDKTIRINLWDVEERRPLLTLPETRVTTLQSMRFSPDGRYLSLVTDASWTRIVPSDWLMEHKQSLACQPNEVAAP